MADDEYRERIRRLRESIPDEDSSVTHIHVHGTSNKIVAHAGDTRMGVTDPPKKEPALIIEILTKLPPNGRVLLTLAIVGAGVFTGHQLGWW